VAKSENTAARGAIRRSKPEVKVPGFYQRYMCSHIFQNSTNTIIYVSTLPDICSHHVLVIDAGVYRVPVLLPFKQFRPVIRWHNSRLECRSGTKYSSAAESVFTS
jgi:hypothetical protein|tara:strand:- start:109 stop:423 length:315 start_codon:yes stop_codon:yes gene_type:complete